MEASLLTQVRAAGLPDPVPEYAFDPGRGWRFDYCWPEARLAVEVEGGTRKPGGGRHNRAAGYERDCEKYNRAALGGWVVLRFTTRMVADGRALAALEPFFRAP
jgi:very-short-patch-repair endonuclease